MSCQALQWCPELIWLSDGQPRQLRQVLAGAAASWTITPYGTCTHHPACWHTYVAAQGVVAGLSVPPILGPNRSSARCSYLRCLHRRKNLSRAHPTADALYQSFFTYGPLHNQAMKMLPRGARASQQTPWKPSPAMPGGQRGLWRGRIRPATSGVPPLWLSARTLPPTCRCCRARADTLHPEP